jgi:IclR family acetate operon transcriptional repressor
MVTMNNDIPVKALHTTFQIIELLSRNDTMTFSEIAEQLDQPNSTIYDHLQSLRKLRYINKVDNEYQINFNFLLIGDRRRSRNELFVKARSVIDDLAEITDEHASLFIEEEERGRTIYTKQGENTVDFKVYDGTQSHLPFTAPGKAILSTYHWSRVEEILDEQGILEDPTTNSISRTELHDELTHTAERGFALDDQVAIEGMRGVAVPIIDKHDHVRGAISIYGPVQRLEEEYVLDKLVSALKTKKNVIELDVNYVDHR